MASDSNSAFDTTSIDQQIQQLRQQMAGMDSGEYDSELGGGYRDPNYSTMNQTLAQLMQQKTDALKAQQMKEQGLNPDGSPIKPGFQSLIDPNTGMLSSQYQLNARPDVQVDQRAIDEIRNRALDKNPSAWAQMATQKQGIEQTDALDKSRAQSAGAMDQNLSRLMMTGGATSGARERLASLGNRDQAMNAQNVYRQGQLDRAGINLQDQTQKNQFLQMVPQLDLSNANIAMQNRQYGTDVQAKNIAAALADVQSKRDYDMGTYHEQMSKWAAGKQADAQASASKGGKK